MSEKITYFRAIMTKCEDVHGKIIKHSMNYKLKI